MTANDILEQIESSGGVVALHGERLRYKLPATATSLLDDLRNHRDAIVDLLRERDSPPVMPQGVRLIRWQPKGAPIILTRWSVVTDSTKFIHETLQQLDAALAGHSWLAGNWSIRELMDRLEQVGVVVVVKHA